MPERAEDAVCIVGYGAILPEAADPGAFWSNLLAGRCSIRELPGERWSRDLYCSPHGRDPDTSSSSTAGFVSDRMLAAAARRLGRAPDGGSRLQIMALTAAAQALAGLPPAALERRRTDVYLGCTEIDERAARRKFMAESFVSLARHVERVCGADAGRIRDRIRRHLEGWEADPRRHRGELFSSSALDLIQRHFALAGDAALIDAACASSLAALDVAMRVLRAGRAELVLAGGVESNLGPDTFVMFSRLGALAPERCLPLDRRTEGLSQGEGAVVFALERLADARRLGHPVHAILRGCGASSDGTGASLFEPTSEGQIRAYEQAYRGLDPRAVDYVECHATGTPVGDAAELRSVIRFFGRRRLPIGSVKSLVGHTKGAAGAVSLLKCLLALKHRTIPPSPYFRSSILDETHGPFVNRRAVRWRQRRRPLCCGVSAFGFGGINYHLVVEEPRADAGRRAARAPRAEDAGRQVVLVARHWRPTAGVRAAEGLRALRIPPNSLEQIDELQLAALLAVVETAAAIHLDPRRLAGAAVSVLAASTLGLDTAAYLGYRVRHAEVWAALEGCDEELRARVLAHRDSYPPVTEDTGPGLLNNVVAGRVANHFDVTGAALNVDADLASYPAALRLAELRLSAEDGLAIVLAADERFNARRFKVDRRGVTCSLLATLDFAKHHNLPIQATLARLRHVPASGS